MTTNSKMILIDVEKSKSRRKYLVPLWAFTALCLSMIDVTNFMTANFTNFTCAVSNGGFLPINGSIISFCLNPLLFLVQIFCFLVMPIACALFTWVYFNSSDLTVKQRWLFVLSAGILLSAAWDLNYTLWVNAFSSQWSSGNNLLWVTTSNTYTIIFFEVQLIFDYLLLTGAVTTTMFYQLIFIIPLILNSLPIWGISFSWTFGYFFIAARLMIASVIFYKYRYTFFITKKRG